MIPCPRVPKSSLYLQGQSHASRRTAILMQEHSERSYSELNYAAQKGLNSIQGGLTTEK
jgi:hypothetical protein